MESLKIIKIGGNVINNESKLEAFVADISQIKEKKIVVHGGGKLLNELSDKLGIKQQMIDGRRVTSKETLQLALMTYAGKINKHIVALLQKNSCNAIGLSGADANIIHANKREIKEIDYGYVGDLHENSINTHFFNLLLKENITPVICSITHDGNGQLLNTNADTLASAISSALSKNYLTSLFFCFEKQGVLTDLNDERSIILDLNYSLYKKFIQESVISEGMIPKLDNAFNALKNNVGEVFILKEENLLETINGNKQLATRIIL